MKVNNIASRLVFLIFLTTAVIFLLSDTVKSLESFYYSIHVSSHKTHSRAEKDVGQLRAKGYDAFYKKVTIPGKGEWYRIYIGRWENREKALSFGQRLKSAGITDYLTTHKLKRTGKTEFEQISRSIRIVAKSGESLYLYKDYHALVVGVSDYNRWPDLPNAVKDAMEVASTLEGLDFKVKLVLNPTSKELSNTLSDIAFHLGSEKNRALFFYFAGHGATLELADGTDLGYIIPSDCPLKRDDPIGFDDKAISMKDLELLALKVKSKHFLMMFDSCFSGSLFNLVRGAPVDITEKSTQPVRQFITAGGAGEQVPDKSVFKLVFLDGITGDADLNSDGYVTGSELGMHLQDKVVNYTRGGQHPQYGKINNPKLDKGDFIFALKAPPREKAPTVVAPPPPPEAGGIEDYDRIMRQRKAAEKKWAQWQARMEEDFAKTERYDQSPELTPKEKVEAWAILVSSYRTDNPYSTKDDELREKAENRRRYWKEFKVGRTPLKEAVRVRKEPPYYPFPVWFDPFLGFKDLNNYFLDSEKADNLFVLKGLVVNEGSENKSFIRIRSDILDSKGKVVKSKIVCAGNPISDKELLSLSMEEINNRLMNASGRNKVNVNILPNSSIPFMVIFGDLPEDMSEFTVEAKSSVQGEWGEIYGDVVSLNKQAEALLGTNPKKALEILEKAIELDPNNAIAYHNRGLAYYKLKQSTKAIQDYTKAIELDPNDAGTYYNRGHTYANLKEYRKAIQDYTKAIELDLNYATAYYNRGLAYYELKQYTKAIQDYNRAIELDLNYAGTYTDRGLAYYKLKQYTKAIQDYNRAIELYPSYAIAYVNRCGVYFSLKEYSNAIKDCNRAIELDPNDAIAYMNRGAVFINLGLEDRGCADLRKACEMRDCDGLQDYRELGYCL